MISCLFLTVDPNAGRFNAASLPDQTLMELLLQRLTLDTSKLEAEDGSFTDCCGWNIVKCDSDKNVTAVHAFWVDSYYNTPQRYAGELDLRLIPSKVKYFDMGNHQLTGLLSLEALPLGLIGFKAAMNSFSGSIGLSQLPETLEKLDVSGNELSGSLRLNKLPKSLVELNVEGNLSGKAPAENERAAH